MLATKSPLKSLRAKKAQRQSMYRAHKRCGRKTAESASWRTKGGFSLLNLNKDSIIAITMRGRETVSREAHNLQKWVQLPPPLPRKEKLNIFQFLQRFFKKGEGFFGIFFEKLIAGFVGDAVSDFMRFPKRVQRIQIRWLDIF